MERVGGAGFGAFFLQILGSLGVKMAFFYNGRRVMELMAKNRRDAMAKGETSYFTGKPCIHGHMAYRYTSSGACSTCVLENATAARQALQPPEELVGVKLRAVAVDASTLLDTAVALTQRRHPHVTREHVVGKGVGAKPEGGTLLYSVNVYPADVQLLRDMQNAMLKARGPNMEEARGRAVGGVMAQAEAARDNGEGEWRFT